MASIENNWTKFQKNGYLILEDFYSPKEVDEMRKEGVKLAEEIHSDVEEKVVFDGVKNSFATKSYFEESADKISPFYEAKAIDENGQIKVDPKLSLARIGHALHQRHPIFKKYVFDERVRNICKELQFEDPAVAISMYLYKNANLNSGVEAHQELSFLYNSSEKLASFWVALDDITGYPYADGFAFADGCIEIIPKSHLGHLYRRYIRNENDSNERFVFDKPMPEFSCDQFVPITVKKGTVIVMDGKLVHRSRANTRPGSFHSFIFNVLEEKDSLYDEKNWCQPKNGFMKLFDKQTKK